MSEDPPSRSLLATILSAFSGGSGDNGGDGALMPVLPDVGGDLLLNVQQFHEKRVQDVMVPRADITAVDIDTPLKKLAKMFGEASHSRLPVYRETLDDPVGVAHIKDVVGHLARYAEATWNKSSDNADAADGSGAGDWGEARILPAIKRPLLYVPASMRALDLLLKMQSRRQHMALVVDEFGGTDGLVTLEDLIEPIVGDIEDEHDETETPMIRARSNGCWEADARAEIVDLEEVIGREIATDEEEADVDTLGGLVFRLAGRVPERGEVLGHPSGFEFEVLDSDPRRIKRVRVRVAAPRGEGEDADHGDAASRSGAA
jgi:CBS domain containing-hemolysin-like protein